MEYGLLSRQELEQEKQEVQQQYDAFKAQGLKLNMARGKPSPEQLDLSMDMLNMLTSDSNMIASTGDDLRNYGMPEGLPELRAILAQMMQVKPENVIIGGNSSLNMMFDFISCGMTHGFSGCKPWSKQETIKFLCPSPGYDRHFAVTEYFGFELILVPMKDGSPDMDVVERLVADDATIKGMWCVPKYSNPLGTTYSDDVVRRIAALKPAAPDFRVMWDNAYCVHHLTDTPDELLDLYAECEKTGNTELPVFFCSTSKITFPGAGIAAMAAGEKTYQDFRKHLSFQTIGPDKLNQMRHLLYLRDMNGILDKMKHHRSIIAPKFEVVLNTLSSELGDKNIASWTNPNGGYFVSVDVMEGCAKRVVQLCKEAGVVLTGAGAAFPYGKDPKDTNIRVAPTYPSLEEMKKAIAVFCVSTKLAALEKLLA
ncbi:MAG: aminotransferase class I/II-fold pyridoxal phosphate-dependent enzyme [Clostridium sp.]|uniref:aminotransferase class I/II-fold pyridoxal phosphate-dependent enzyme n=1 Tax=Clostridium sp. TaxID=1506 RepID=UPI00290DD42D|nr:aminotransferase class I/II-fold pyridoxal phosphate-dependent enzyme [Clostridium sp.]MDU7337628.1 aminotransferase class I/II-fold pyridoxal phosphate-dependent enzyme [Clostridium sp.]